uniref:Uncharacterized protein n=1 Tax=Acrobeloides nanus TaxID=290746 RepID=A0A914EH14_9BILA
MYKNLLLVIMLYLLTIGYLLALNGEFMEIHPKLVKRNATVIQTNPMPIDGGIAMAEQLYGKNEYDDTNSWMPIDGGIAMAEQMAGNQGK